MSGWEPEHPFFTNEVMQFQGKLHLKCSSSVSSTASPKQSEVSKGGQAKQERDEDARDCHPYTLALNQAVCHEASNKVFCAIALLLHQVHTLHRLSVFKQFPQSVLQQDLAVFWSCERSAQKGELFLISCNWIWKGLYRWCKINCSEQLMFSSLLTQLSEPAFLSPALFNNNWDWDEGEFPIFALLRGSRRAWHRKPLLP